MPICFNSRKPSLNTAWFFLAFALPVFLQAQSEDVRRIKLIFAGDIMGHETQIRAAEVEKDKLYDYTPCFEYVAPILKQADLAIGNLELTLPGKPPYTGYPMFKSPEELALALRHAGFDLLVTSNNHSNDGGLNGVISTLNTLDNYNFYHTGTFRDSLERNDFYPLIVYKNDFRLAFLNYTYGTNGLNTKPPSVVNLIDEKLIAADMEIARQMAPDFIIVIMHWGDEYQINENKIQRDLAAKLVGWGADLVIGAHPHVVQPVRQETVAGADSTARKVWTAYSLGNYISGQRKINTDGGMMLEVELQKSLPAGPTTLTDIAFIPTWVWIQTMPTGKKHYRILPVAAFEQENSTLPKLSETDRVLLKRHGAALRKHLSAIRERVIRAEDLLSE